MNAPVAIVGAGGFGAGLAHTASRVGREVIVWSRSRRLDAGGKIQVTDSLADLTRAELIFVAVPSPHVRVLATEAGKHLDGRHHLVHVSRGLEGDSLTPVSRILHEVTPCRRIGALAGPLVTDALRNATPSGGIVASPFPEVRKVVREAIGSPSLRVYETDDLVGVELASAMVGLLALAAGLARGSGGGPAALAIVVARGFAEARRLGTVFGAEERTFAGLAGFGDAVAVAAGDGRPELLVGEALAQGQSIEAAIRHGGAYVEAIGLSERLSRYADQAGIELPIVSAVSDVVSGRTTVNEAVDALMRRPQRSE